MLIICKCGCCSVEDGWKENPGVTWSDEEGKRDRNRCFKTYLMNAQEIQNVRAR
jgi:hypothetical protein